MGTKRTMLLGDKKPDVEQSIQLTIDTKCPGKWAFVDMETGDIWVKNPAKESRYWKHASEKDLANIIQAVKHELK